MVSKMADENFQFDAKAAFQRVMAKARMRQSIPKLRNPKQRKVITLSYRWAAAVAALLVLSGAMFYLWMSHPSETAVVYQEIIVPLGSRSKVVLPDGSQVNLNAGSTLRYPTVFGVERRDLWLDGEGFFEVSKSSKPFVVHSGDVQIKALGTSFNVRAYSSEKVIETTLVSGKIEVTGNNRENRESWGNGNQSVTLLPNQKLIIPKTEEMGKVGEMGKMGENVEMNSPSSPISPSSSPISPSSPTFSPISVDPKPDISWKDNKWVINREDLGSLAVKLERRFDIEIVFKDEQLKSFRYNGSLPDFSLEQVLNVMSMVSPINYSINGKTVVFSENKNYKNHINP